MRLGELKFLPPKPESNGSSFSIEGAASTVIDILYHIKPIYAIIIKSDSLELIGTENDRRAFFELKFLLHAVDQSSNDLLINTTTFLRALGVCNGMDYMNCKYHVSILNFWNDVIRLVLVVIPPLREIFLGSVASAQEVPGWLNLVSEAQRCFHVIKNMNTLEEVFHQCLSAAASQEALAPAVISGVDKIVSKNALILRRSPAVLAIGCSPNSPIIMKYPLEFDMADFQSVESASTVHIHGAAHIHGEFPVAPVATVEEVADKPKPSSSRPSAQYFLAGVYYSHLGIAEEAADASEVVTGETEQRYFFREFGQKVENAPAVVPVSGDSVVEAVVSATPSSELLSHWYGSQMVTVNDSVVATVDASATTGSTAIATTGTTATGSVQRMSPLSSVDPTTLQSTANANPTLLVYIRKDVTTITDRISLLVTKAGQMRSIGDVAFQLAMTTQNYSEARRCYEEAIILDPSLKPSLQDNFNTLEKIEKTNRARLLEEQADLALANRRFREASDLYSRAMMSAVVGSGVYLWAREKLDYVTRIISLDVACQYVEKGTDALVAGNLNSAKEYFSQAFKFNPELIHLQSIMLGLEKAIQNHNANQKLAETTAALKCRKYKSAQNIMLDAISHYPEKLTQYKELLGGLEPFIQVEEAAKKHKTALSLAGEKKHSAAIAAFTEAIDLMPTKEYVNSLGVIPTPSSPSSSSVTAIEADASSCGKDDLICAEGSIHAPEEQKLFTVFYQSGWTDDLSEFLCNRAASYHELKEYDKAIANCEAALAVKPESALAHFRLGTIYFAQDRYDEAGNCYDRALQCDPGISESVKVKNKQLTTAKEIQLRKEREIQKQKEREDEKTAMEEKKQRDEIVKKEKAEKLEKERLEKVERDRRKAEEKALKQKEADELLKEKDIEKERIKADKLQREQEKQLEREKARQEKEKERERLKSDKEAKLLAKKLEEEAEKERLRLIAEEMLRVEERRREIEREKEAEKERARFEMERTIAEREKQRAEKLLRQQQADSDSKKPVSAGVQVTEVEQKFVDATKPKSTKSQKNPIVSAPISAPVTNVSREPVQPSTTVERADSVGHALGSNSLADNTLQSLVASLSTSTLSAGAPSFDSTVAQMTTPSTPVQMPLAAPVQSMDHTDVNSLKYPSLDLSAPIFIPNSMKTTAANTSGGTVTIVGGNPLAGGRALSNSSVTSAIISQLQTMPSSTCEQCNEFIDGTNRLSAYGFCNHRFYCSVCMLSRRVLMKSITCPTCSQVCDTMACTSIKPAPAFTTLNLQNNSDMVFDRRSKMYFPKDYYHTKIMYLSVYTCPVCNYHDMNADTYQMHIYNMHGLGICQNCVVHKPIFPAYQIAYPFDRLRDHMIECIQSNDDDGTGQIGGGPGGGRRGKKPAFDATSPKFEEEFPTLGAPPAPVVITTPVAKPKQAPVTSVQAQGSAVQSLTPVAAPISSLGSMSDAGAMQSQSSLLYNQSPVMNSLSMLPNNQNNHSLYTNNGNMYGSLNAGLNMNSTDGLFTMESSNSLNMNNSNNGLTSGAVNEMSSSLFASMFGSSVSTDNNSLANSLNNSLSNSMNNSMNTGGSKLLASLNNSLSNEAVGNSNNNNMSSILGGLLLNDNHTNASMNMSVGSLLSNCNIDDSLSSILRAESSQGHNQLQNNHNSDSLNSGHHHLLSQSLLLDSFSGNQSSLHGAETNMNMNGNSSFLSDMLNTNNNNYPMNNLNSSNDGLANNSLFGLSYMRDIMGNDTGGFANGGGSSMNVGSVGLGNNNDFFTLNSLNQSNYTNGSGSSLSSALASPLQTSSPSPVTYLGLGLSPSMTPVTVGAVATSTTASATGSRRNTLSNGTPPLPPGIISPIISTLPPSVSTVTATNPSPPTPPAVYTAGTSKATAVIRPVVLSNGLLMRGAEIPREAMGLVIGQSGKKIKEMSVNSGAKLQFRVQKAGERDSKRGVLEITGQEAQCEIAFQMVKDLLQTMNYSYQEISLAK